MIGNSEINTPAYENNICSSDRLLGYISAVSIFLSTHVLISGALESLSRGDKAEAAVLSLISVGDSIATPLYLRSKVIEAKQKSANDPQANYQLPYFELIPWYSSFKEYLPFVQRIENSMVKRPKRNE